MPSVLARLFSRKTRSWSHPSPRPPSLFTNVNPQGTPVDGWSSGSSSGPRGEEVSQKQTGRRPGRKGKHDPIDWESTGLEGAESAPLLRGDASVPGRKDGERTSKPTNPHVSFTQDNEQRNCTGGCFIPRLSAPLDHYTARLVAGVVKKPWWSLGARQEDETSTRKDERKWTQKMRSTPSRGQRVCKGGVWACHCREERT